jgi:hypothetical protein
VLSAPLSTTRIPRDADGTFYLEKHLNDHLDGNAADSMQFTLTQDLQHAAKYVVFQARRARDDAADSEGSDEQAMLDPSEWVELGRVRTLILSLCTLCKP